MRAMKLFVIGILFCTVEAQAQSCPLFFFENAPGETPPVVSPSPIFSGIGSFICVAPPSCVYRDNSDPLPSITVTGNSIDIEVPTRYRGFLSPDDCGSERYIPVNLPALPQGSYSVNYILRYTQVVAGPLSFERTGTVIVGGAPSPIPTFSWGGVILLSICIGLFGFRRLRN